MDRLAALAQQLEELEAVESVHPGALCLEPAERQAVEIARAAVEAVAGAAAATGAAAAGSGGGGDADAAAFLPEISGALRLPDGTDGAAAAAGGVGAGGARIRFALPPGYPLSTAAPARLALECAAPRDAHDALTSELCALAAGDWAGAPCLLLALGFLEAKAPELEALRRRQEERRGGAAEAGAGRGAAAAAAGASGGGFMRAAVWSHHIKSEEKRKHIVNWARDLGLRGLSKPGFPGAVLVEGPEAAVRDYLARLRALKWQAMQVRAESVVPLLGNGGGGSGGDGNNGRVPLPWAFGADAAPLRELPEAGGLAEMGRRCGGAPELEELFRALLKL